MTRSQYEQSCAAKRGIIHALKDNLGDEFSALEISAAMIDPPDLEPRQIGAVLKSMVAEGLVSKRPSKNMNIYRLTKKALTWQPSPYDWRAEGAKDPLPESAPEPVTAKQPTAGKVNGTPVAPVTLPPAKPVERQRPKPPVTKPADNHPWVHPPAVTKDKPDRGGITRPLPVHLETPDPRHSPASPDPGALDLDDTDLAAMALPAVPIEPALGAKAFLVANPPHEASRQLVVDNCTASGQAILDDSSYSEIPNSSPTEASSPEIPDISNHPEIPDSSPDVAEHEAPNAAQQTLPTDSREDEPLAQPEITPAAISGCGGNGTCGGHCANHAKDGDEDYLEESLERALAEIANLTDNMECLESYKDSLANQLSEAQSKLADALADLATSQRERDLLHQRLRDQARHEPAMMADCLMELLRLALLRIPHPDHYAGVGKMVGSEARP